MERQNEESIQQMKSFTDNIDRLLLAETDQVTADIQNSFYMDDEDDDLEPVTTWEEDADEFTDPDAFDEYIGAKIMIPQGDVKMQGRVTKRVKGEARWHTNRKTR